MTFGTTLVLCSSTKRNQRG
jgi:hypothetical protein